MKFDTLGDWCKWLEYNFSPDIMIPTLPVIIRLDGNNFHNWARELEKPFDEGLVDLMIETTRLLVEETNAIAGYTQSDEITLVLYSKTKDSSIYNDGKKQKILSKLTGKCVSIFNTEKIKYLPNHNKIANFDCRIYQTPTLADACNQILWRENDAVKNSVSMLAQSLFSHKSLHGLKSNQMKDKMMLEKGINWNDLPSKYKKGSHIKRVRTSKPFSAEEIAQLPERHEAKKNPDLIIERNVITSVEYPIFSEITNRVGVVFYDEEPELIKEIE